MIVLMKHEAVEQDVQRVVERIEKLGFKANVSKGVERTVIGIIGDERFLNKDQISLLPNVENIIPILKPYKLASREFQPTDSVISVDGVLVGGSEIVIMAGPCSVESEDQMLESAEIVKKAGIKILRGGAFKPRTSPYSFQGMGKEGLKILEKAKKFTGLKIITEVMDTTEIELVAEYADILQVGTRNMQNTKLLQNLGKIKKPVLLKRNYSATLAEFLLSAEYILSNGNDQVILCERGIRTFVEYTRNTLDLNIVPAIKQLSHLPIIVDPSHGTGRHDFIIPMSRAALAAGADGLIVEMHPKPEEATSDGEQSLKPEKLFQLMKEADLIANAIGRTLL
ncbi:MAG: 3-deoxy-7-phosphoheptulonate synthase [Bacteroidota bacterium]|nr:3-deoxy-7-phosphoheptulonate synthase [Bacteroidota bacterium]